MPDAFTRESKVRDVVAHLGERGEALLLEHGYDVGEGFSDVLSQYQSLRDAARAGRLRNVEALLETLNRG